MDPKFLVEKYLLNKHQFPEPLVLQRMKRIRGGVFFDVGANNGMFSMSLRRNFTRIMAFEPDAQTFSVLMERTMPEGNIMPLCVAVSDRTGWATLYSPSDDSFCPTIIEGLHYCPRSKPLVDMFLKGDRWVHVRSISIDDAMRDYGFHYIDMMKIDVEGAEFLVLKGSRDSLREGRIGSMMIELHNRDRKAELETILEKNSFSYVWIDEDHIFAKHNQGYCPDL